VVVVRIAAIFTRNYTCTASSRIDHVRSEKRLDQLILRASTRCVSTCAVGGEVRFGVH
jgi:hypothetical protein